MISYQRGSNSRLHLLPQESSLVRERTRDRVSSMRSSVLLAHSPDDFAFSAAWLQIRPQFALLPYIVDIQTKIINEMRSELEVLQHQRDLLEHQLDQLLELHGAADDVITLRLDVESSVPARIVSEIDAPFHYFGEETEE